jgi:peptidoglycan/LPS O-acetylase OafA/YrhL
MNEAPKRMPSLDGIRAISILFVLFGHAVGTAHFLTVEQAGPLMHVGELGVRVFFVLSGFLITTLLLKEIAADGRIHLGRFYIRRTLRIFPAFYVFVFVLIALDVAGWIALNAGDRLHALTYTSNYAPERSWYIGHTWSLAVEEQFYLLWPAVLLLAGRRRGMWIALAVVLLSPFVRLAIWQMNPTEASGVGHRFETVADSIAVGCLLAGSAAWLQGFGPYRRLLASRAFALVPLAVFGASLLADRPRIQFFVGFTVMNVGIALCLHWCLLNAEGRVGRALNWAPLAFLGTLSYSVYLWQQIFLNRYDPSMPGFPANLALVAIAALGSYYLVERPALAARPAVERWFLARARRRAEPAPPEVEAPAPAALDEAAVGRAATAP